MVRVYSGAAMAMTRTNVFLGASQRQKLAQRSEQTGAPVAELIRRAIDEYLAGALRLPAVASPHESKEGIRHTCLSSHSTKRR